MIDLWVACENADVPQQWIASSLCFAVDTDIFKRYRQPKEKERLCDVWIADWGMSTLETKEEFDNLSDDDKHTRIEHWSNYVDTILRLLFECMHYY